MRGLDAPSEWLRVVAQSGCVDLARRPIPEIEKRSAIAPQVRMRRKCKMGIRVTVHAVLKEALARCVGFEQSTRNEANKFRKR
eukprot:6204727-Pleurochrysis_carterae.AAC.2